MYHPQGAQYAKLKTNWQRQVVIFKVQQSAAGSVIDVNYV
jgi:hypothetical protein